MGVLLGNWQLFAMSRRSQEPTSTSPVLDPTTLGVTPGSVWAA